jgi:DNA-binding NtrC family response regulator
MALVLIVEDEATILVLAESVLQERGHQTLSASSVTEATVLLEEHRKIDLLFTDIGLKDDPEAGLKLAADAIGQHPEIKVLYTTGQAVTDGMKALFVGKSAMLPKPYTVEQLLTSLSMLGINHPHVPASN